jgi:hypothetical protein
MRSQVRYSLLALVVGAILAVSAPAAQAAFEATGFESLTCKVNETSGCPELFKQAAGHPDFGITDFTFNGAWSEGNGIKVIRTDLPVGFSTNPQALPQCSLTEFEANDKKAEANKCEANTQAGTQEVLISLGGLGLEKVVGAAVYNLDPEPGLPLEFGIDIPIVKLGGIHAHSLLKGFVSWHKEREATEEGIESGDYHEFFKLEASHPLSSGLEPPLLHSRLVFEGNKGTTGKGFLLTTPTACPGPQTSHLRVESYAGTVLPPTSYVTTPSASEEKCGNVPFELEKEGFSLTPSSKRSDAPDGINAELKFPPVNAVSTQLENSDLKSSVVTLPEGLTLNPAAAHGLEACTPEELGVGTENESVSCPSRSVIGSAVLTVPGLPPESLRGNIYLGEKAAGAITGPPYLIYVVTESKRYGQIVRIEGAVEPNPATGRLTATFAENPQGPFREFKLNFSGGPLANLANPLTCGAAVTNGVFTPFSPLSGSVPLFPEFAVDSNPAGGPCPSTPPFAPAQSSSVEPAQGGAGSTFTLNLERADGQQYISKLRNVLPPGLVGIIPSVTQCGEPQASAGTCTSASQIGTVTVSAGAGSEPFNFPGKVYLTGPFEGAPYGLSIVVPSIAGPFNLGNVIARAKIEVDPHTAQVIATDNAVPSIVGGIPIRMKSLSISLSRQGFERNPTNCGVLATESTLTGSLGTTANVSTPFQAEGCSSLAFKPTFAESTSGKPSKAKGASLVTTITQGAGQANFKSVLVTLPKQLPSRLTTLQKACPEATFAANPLSCPSASNVGTATAVTPVLPGKMTGPAYLVSHGGAAFPDLDIVLEGNGVRIILIGNTDIKKGITTTKFAATPDAPFSSFTLNLPTGPHSALAANGDLCKPTLVMPTTLTAQNGKQVKQNTKITPTGCGIRIVGHKVVGKTAYVTVKTFAPGRISGSGSGLSTARRTLNNATKAATLKIPLSRRGRSRHRPFRTRVRVGFVPKKKGAHSRTSVVVRFR